MEAANIWKKIKFKEVTLALAEVKLMATDPEAQFRKIWNYSIQKHTKETLTLKVDFKAFFVPEAFFDIHLEYIVNYQIDEAVTQSEIEESIDVLLGPCADTNSLIIGFLTDKMGYSPMMVQPKFDLTNDN